MAHILSNVDLEKEFDRLKDNLLSARSKFENSNDEYKTAILAGELTGHISGSYLLLHRENVKFDNVDDIPKNLFSSPLNNHDELNESAGWEDFCDDKGNGNFQY